MNLETYRQKLLGCWMGKNIGGTLGAPFEWYRGINDVTYYTQELSGNPLPNDDLDIQLLWLVMLEEQGIEVNAALMAEYWQHFVTPHWAEYGNAKINLQGGLQPPYSGIRNNYFKDSCGAFIRSEIWACIAPGNPQLAATYAYEDASIDHGDGEGMYAEIFTAVMESAAFVINDPKKLIDIGLSYIPADCGIAGAVRLAVTLYDEGKTWLAARDEMLRQFRGSAFYNNINRVAQADIDKGFADGKLGWDAPSNIGILVMGLLYGEGDFDKSLCVAVNCGEDTDCTGATIGALFGIMHGIEAIGEKWITPIGRSIKTACLNLGELGYFGNQLPQNIDELTHRTEAIMRKVAAFHPLPVEIPATEAKPVNPESLYKRKDALPQINKAASRHKFPLFDITVEHLTGPGMHIDNPAKIKVTVTNKYRVQAGLTLRWYQPDGWKISPAPEIKSYVRPNGWDDPFATHTFTFTPPEHPTATNRFMLEVTVDGRATVMPVPVVLYVEG